MTVDPYRNTSEPRYTGPQSPPMTNYPAFSSWPVDLNVKPTITDYDQIVRMTEVCEMLDVKPATLRRYMRGVAGKQKFIALPYVRVGGALYFYKSQIAWWLRQIQEQPDPMMVDVSRAMREGGK